MVIETEKTDLKYSREIKGDNLKERENIVDYREGFNV
jgi:hypothetical protein